MRRVPVAMTLLALLAAACSVTAESSANPVAPEDLPPDLQPAVTASTSTTPAPEGAEVGIYLYDTSDQRLETVNRRVDGPSVNVEDALRQLFTAVPTPQETNRNLITQLVADPDDPDDPGAAPEQLELVQVRPGESVVRIRIAGTIAGQNQARAQAFAQIVFTASEPDLEDARDLVLIQNARGQNLQVTTEAGTEETAVGRADYPTLDPANAEDPPLNTGPSPPTTAPTTTTAVATAPTIVGPPGAGTQGTTTLGAGDTSTTTRP